MYCPSSATFWASASSGATASVGERAIRKLDGPPAPPPSQVIKLVIAVHAFAKESPAAKSHGAPFRSCASAIADGTSGSVTAMVWASEVDDSPAVVLAAVTVRMSTGCPLPP